MPTPRPIIAASSVAKLGMPITREASPARPMPVPQAEQRRDDRQAHRDQRAEGDEQHDDRREQADRRRGAERRLLHLFDRLAAERHLQLRRAGAFGDRRSPVRWPTTEAGSRARRTSPSRTRPCRRSEISCAPAAVYGLTTPVTCGSRATAASIGATRARDRRVGDDDPGVRRTRSDRSRRPAPGSRA